MSMVATNSSCDMSENLVAPKRAVGLRLACARAVAMLSLKMSNLALISRTLVYSRPYLATKSTKPAHSLSPPRTRSTAPMYADMLADTATAKSASVTIRVAFILEL